MTASASRLVIIILAGGGLIFAASPYSSSSSHPYSPSSDSSTSICLPYHNECTSCISNTRSAFGRASRIRNEYTSSEWNLSNTTARTR